MLGSCCRRRRSRTARAAARAVADRYGRIRSAVVAADSLRFTPSCRFTRCARSGPPAVAPAPPPASHKSTDVICSSSSKAFCSRTSSNRWMWFCARSSTPQAHSWRLSRTSRVRCSARSRWRSGLVSLASAKFSCLQRTLDVEVVQLRPDSAGAALAVIGLRHLALDPLDVRNRAVTTYLRGLRVGVGPRTLADGAARTLLSDTVAFLVAACTDEVRFHGDRRRVRE